ncbi:MAG: hypothetical protein ACREQN_14560 [Candidatus Binataceae bacterium]
MANKGTCKVNDCNHEVIAKGYCRRHYRLWRHGQMPKPRYKICTTEKCRKPRFRGSLCQQHYAAAHGNKAAAGRPPAASTASATPAASA